MNLKTNPTRSLLIFLQLEFIQAIMNQQILNAASFAEVPSSKITQKGAILLIRPPQPLARPSPLTPWLPLAPLPLPIP